MQKIRCAIYTRKSTDEGLDMELNTLDVQREAAENYIRSQAHEGWVILPERYDDGGFSGGNMQRPAFQKLMSDIEEGFVDMIVVYKIDRLTRSLNDFSKMMDVLDKHEASFVSVTQQFNTSTSMGRLTLNMLLSFAQFEREVGAERTRDKIASSKMKGMWMGGCVPLGYDNVNKKLIINDDEAKIVKLIFKKYIEFKSYAMVAAYLNKRGFRCKQWISNTGKEHGGRVFDRVVIYKHLKNTIYIGKITHKKKEYEGQHEAIIDMDLWNQVRKILKKPTLERKLVYQEEDAGPLLKGLLRCGCCNQIMVHSTTKKTKSKGYRYYVSNEAVKKGFASCKVKSVPAQEIEDLAIEEVKKILQSPEVIKQTYEELKLLKKSADEELFFRRMTNFGNIWEYLYPGEVKKIIRSLIKEIIINEENIKIKINIEGLTTKMKEYDNANIH